MKTNKPLQRNLTRLAACAALLSAGHLAQAQNIWQGTSNVSASTNWSDTANWSLAMSPAGGDVQFDNTGSSTVDGQINSVVDASLGIASLTFTNQSGRFHTILIPGGVTLTGSGQFNVGSSPSIDTNNTKVSFVGGGTLSYAGGMVVRNNCSSGTGSLASLATLDLSGLSNFALDASGAALAVAGTGGEARPAGLLILAGVSNHINAATVSLSTSTGNANGTSGTSSAIRLGLGTNVLNVGNLNVVAGKATAGSVFGFYGATGGLRLRGANGDWDDTSRVTILVANRNSGGSGSVSGTVDLSGNHPLDIKADTITVAQATTGNPSGAQTCTGKFIFGAGTVDATTVNLAVNSQANVTSTGTLVVGGGSLVVNNLSLVNRTAGGGSGTLLITNAGVVNCLGSVIKTTSAGTGTIAINNGQLNVGQYLGTVSAPLDSLSLTGATLTLPASAVASANVTNLVCGGVTNRLNISDLPVVSGYPVQFPLIKYTGTVGGTFNLGVGSFPVSSPAYAGYLVNNTANGSIDLVLTSGPQPARVLTWRGTPSGDWDTTTANWLFNTTPSVFNPADFVRFDDSASGSTAVNLTTTLLPSSITVSNNAKTYGFGGYGTLSGETSLTKEGTGTLFITNNAVNDFTGLIAINAGTVQVGNGDYSGSLGSSAVINNGALVMNRADDVTLANTISGSGSLVKRGGAALILPVANTFSGPVMVNSGTLRPANGGALGTTNGATVVASGATLDVNGQNLGAEPVTVQGAGDGNGAIINSGNNQNNALRYVTLAGDTTVGGTARWDIRGSNTANPTTAGLSTGGNAYKLTKIGPNQVSLTGVTVDPALGAVDVQSGILSLEVATTGLGNPASTLTVFPGASLQFYGLTNQLNKVISLTYDGVAYSLINGSGANTILGPVTMNGDGAFNIGGVSLNLAGPLTGGLLSKQGFGNLILSGAATHAGTTVLVGSLTVNGTHTAGVTNSGGTTLAGNGTVSGFADVSGTLAPGGTNSVGTLTVGGLVLQGGASAAFDLTNAATIGGGVNDLVVVNGDLVLNGNTIQINPQGLLKTGVPYRLFNYTGNLTVNSALWVPDVAGYSFVVDTAVHGQVNLVASGGPPIWTGGSSTGSYWTDAANWNNVSLQAGNSLYFGGTTRLNNTNNTGAGTGYGDVSFAADSGAFVLNGDPITLGGTVVNNSTNVQTLNLGLSYSANRTLNGLAAPLVLAGGVTNTAANYTTLTLNGTGTLVNLLGSADPAGTNTLAVAGTNANWTVVDNAAALPMTAPWALSLNNGTFNFGTESSAPVLTSTTVNGMPSDNQVGTVAGGVGTFNMVGGSLTTLARLNTATAANSTGIVHQVGGTLTIAAMLQGANGSNPNEQSIVRISGGTMNIGTAAAPNSGFYVASRGCGELSLSGTGRLNCGTVDIARNAAGNSYQCAGVVNLDGGTLAVNRVGSATSSAQTGMTYNPSATFNFNGGTLLARNNSATFFQGSTVAPVIPIKAVVKAGGAIIDSDVFSISVLEPLVHDTALGSTPDGGLIKNGTGTLTLTAASSYTGATLVNSGTLLVNGSVGPTTVSVESGATLGGTGTVIGNVTVKTNGTVTAGAANAAGVLTVAGDLTLQAGATAFMELNKTAAVNDQIRASAAAPTTITYGGTLALTNLDGVLAAGDSFQLFQASSYAGAFAATNLPSLPANLAWVWTPTNGTLSVVSAGAANPTANSDVATTAWNVPLTLAPLANDTDPASLPLTLVSVSPTNGMASIVNSTNVLFTASQGFVGPAYIGYTITNGNGGTASSLITVTVTAPPKAAISSVTHAGTSLVLSGTNGAPNGIYSVLTSTDVALALTNWVPVLTNTFDGNGRFTESLPVNTTVPKSFFLLKQ